MLQYKFIRTCIGILAVLAIIYMVWKVSFIFRPVVTMVNLLLVPFVIAGFFYYLLRPIVHYLDTRKVKRTVSVLLIYFVFAGILVILAKVVWPTLQHQVVDFVNNVPNLLQDLSDQITAIQQQSFFSALVPTSSDFSARLSNFFGKGFTIISGYLSGVYSFINSFVIVIGTAPIILFYMLKESGNVTPRVLNIVPRRYRADGMEVLSEMDSAVGGYISGRMISTGILAVMTLIGFLLIGMPYALLLTMVNSILSFIPYVGVFLGAIPCVIVAFTVSPNMVLWVLIVIVVTQQIQDNLLAPMIFGKKVDIHPLTTVILLLVAGDVAGIIGMLLAIPVYMAAKIIVKKVYELFLSKKVEKMVE